jgi:uncharacterized membrane protein YphA (DoxX/SURF4 family)
MSAADALALALAAVFAWAGAAKAVDRRTTARTFRALGLPAVTALTTVVPATELLLAAGLVLVPGAAAPVALAVLAGFTVLLFRARRAGVAVGCGCFGTARRGPVSGRDLVRNGVLGLVAVVVAVDQGTAAAGALLAGGGCVVALALRPASSTRLGRPAPSVPGLDYGAASRTVLAFVARGCERCDAARAAVGALGPGVQARVIEDDPALFAAFDVRTAPVVLTVDREGVVVDAEAGSTVLRAGLGQTARRWRSTSRSRTRSRTGSSP